nr:MAG TPA: hypothetical protein [Crassvirales sp.]
MIVLLSCSISLSGSNQYIPSTGELVNQDSVNVSINDLRIVNSKLVELKYEKEANKILRNIVYNDSCIIDDNNKTINQLKTKVNKVTKQRNVIGVAGAASIILFIISIL